MQKIGRNDTCHCGSGKKYKKCCMIAEFEARLASPPETPENQTLAAALANREFDSMDGMQAFAEQKIQQLNSAPRAELGGFSPDQLQTLLYMPLQQQKLIRWRDNSLIQNPEKIPVLVIFHAIRDYLAEHKAKATARGNLPRALVKYVLACHIEKFGSNFTLVHINKEADYRELKITRVLLEEMGWLCLEKGYFKLNKQALTQNHTATFKRLFQSHIGTYNWAYADKYPVLNFIQRAACYSLVALHRLGGKVCETKAFADDFISVFPTLLDELENVPYPSASNTANHCYSLRTIRRCWEFFGLVQIEGGIFYSLSGDKKETFQATALFQQVFEFPAG